MSVEPHVIRSKRYDEIGGLIKRDAGILIERWRQRAMVEEPGAQRVHQAALLDHLAAFLVELADHLAGSDASENGAHCQPARQHGEQRWEAGWSLPEVIRDYRILRLVIQEYLDERLDRPLTGREVMAVGLALDEAIAASVVMYVKHREEDTLKVEREWAARDRAAAAALRRWEQIFQHAGWGMAVLDAATDHLQTVNTAFAQMHGYEVAELSGRALADLIAPEARADLATHLAAAREQGHHVYETVHVRKDGSSFPVLTDVTTFKDEAGNVVYRAASFQDVTAQKRLEESLRAQTEALQAAQRHKDEFLAVLAHELRNFLAPTVQSVAALQLLPTANPSVRQMTEVVERQSKQMVRVVDDLLDVSRISQGAIELRKHRLNLAVAAARAVQTSEPWFKDRGHDLALQVPSEGVWVEGDATRLVQVLTNLLNNAAKYTPAGGRVSLTVAREGAEAVVRVRDNGRGIPPDKLDRVFEAFTQLARPVDGSPDGLGIGLTLVRRLVAMHGGTITAASEGPGRGSEFVVRLPAVAPPASEAPPAAPPASAATRRILLIEDNADARVTLQLLLQLKGHQVAAAAAGTEGVQMALANPPEVALIDLGLPGMDGYQVAQKLRAALGNSVRLLALTGYGQEEDRRRTQEAGFDAHLVKPVDPEELARVFDQPVGVPR